MVSTPNEHDECCDTALPIPHARAANTPVGTQKGSASPSLVTLSLCGQQTAHLEHSRWAPGSRPGKGGGGLANALFHEWHCDPHSRLEP